MKKHNILVIGDTCKDVFVYCHCERLCPEGPVPVLDVVEKVENYGMAGNVFRNVECLGQSVQLITNHNKDEVTKTRYVERKTNHLFLRIDSDAKVSPIQGIRKISFDKYAAVIISDYNKGFLSEADIEYIGTKNSVTFLDTKKKLGPWAKTIRYIKINRKEFSLTQDTIQKYELSDKIIQTLGEGGCQFRGQNYPVQKVEVKDLSGAGDSFLAALVVKYLEKYNMAESLVAANDAATIVVQKMGVSLIKD
jgi:D-beta-D-heptose 7-phosphate kinase/D-beta-D-heptose 1-phosphate adenosyltransferase